MSPCMICDHGVQDNYAEHFTIGANKRYRAYYNYEENDGIWIDWSVNIEIIEIFVRPGPLPTFHLKCLRKAQLLKQVRVLPWLQQFPHLTGIYV